MSKEVKYNENNEICSSDNDYEFKDISPQRGGESNIICAEQAMIFATSSFYAPILIHGTNQTN